MARLVRNEQIVRDKPEVQRTGRRDLQTIIVNRKSDGATTHRVVSVAKGVRQRLPCRERWVKGLVNAFDLTRAESAGNGQGVSKKAFRGRKKCERVANELPIVEKLGAIKSTKSRHAQEALRHLAFKAFGTPEKNLCRPKDDFPALQSQPAQQIFGFSGAGFVEAANSDGFRDGIPNLGYIQIPDCPSISGLVLPSLLTVHALKRISLPRCRPRQTGTARPHRQSASTRRRSQSRCAPSV